MKIFTEQKDDCWIQTYSGKRFWPLDPRVEDIDILDIAHSLAMQCRYTGHCIDFYSVAEHSILVSRWLEAQGIESGWGLLHDASEAYLGDIARPWKDRLYVNIEYLSGRLDPFEEAEQKILKLIAFKYNLSWPIPEVVKKADLEVFSKERDANMSCCFWKWKDYTKPANVVLTFLSPEKAEKEFMKRFTDLFSRP